MHEKAKAQRLHSSSRWQNWESGERMVVGEGTVREFGMDMSTLLYLRWITHKGLPYSTENCAQCYGADWMGGEFGGEWVHVYVWLSPFAQPETITTLLSSCTSI